MKANRHELQFNQRLNRATCRCGNWGLFDQRQTLLEDSVKTNFTLHVTNAAHKTPYVGTFDEDASTFPDVLIPLRDKFVEEATGQPAFAEYKTTKSLTRAMEHRLFEYMVLHPDQYEKLQERERHVIQA